MSLSLEITNKLRLLVRSYPKNNHIMNQPYYEPAILCPPDGDDGGGRIFPEHPSPILHAPRDNISRKDNPSIRYTNKYKLIYNIYIYVLVNINLYIYIYIYIYIWVHMGPMWAHMGQWANMY